MLFPLVVTRPGNIIGPVMLSALVMVQSGGHLQFRLGCGLVESWEVISKRSEVTLAMRSSLRSGTSRRSQVRLPLPR